MDQDQDQHRASDTGLEFVIIVGFFGVMGALFFQTIPDSNKSAFDQLTGALILVFGLVAKSLWDRRGQAFQIATKAMDNAQETLPRSVTPLLLPPPAAALEEPVARGTERGVKDAIEDVTRDGAVSGLSDAARAALEPHREGKAIIE